jgi:hypothetical protein
LLSLNFKKKLICEGKYQDLTLMGHFEDLYILEDRNLVSLLIRTIPLFSSYIRSFRGIFYIRIGVHESELVIDRHVIPQAEIKRWLLLKLHLWRMEIRSLEPYDWRREA